MLEILEKAYPKSMGELKNILGDKNIGKISGYLHVYDGSSGSVKPVAKNITIYLIAKATDRLIIRTEGEDDIILSNIGGGTVPTIIFRKFKAVLLRNFMELTRVHWTSYSNDIQNIYDVKDYDFYNKCAISPGVAGEGKGAMHGRCMKCPVDVLMGATSAGAQYNLSSRMVGESFYATTEDCYERVTGNAVDETTHTTIMLTGRETTEEERTGALFSETLVRPGTFFVGKTVLFMPSPVELLYVLWLLTRHIRVGARTSIWGSLKIMPVAMIADLYEVGSSYEATEKVFGKRDEDGVRSEVLKYIRELKYATGTEPIEITTDMINEIRALDILKNELALELWRNAKNYIDGVMEYIGTR